MTFSEAIKNGFSLINRQWQLVLIQVVMWVINCVGLVTMVGIPLGIAVILLGLDLTAFSETRNVLGLLQNPGALFSKYLGLFLIVMTSILFYLIIATTIWLYVFGGTAGMISRSLLEPAITFSMQGFFGEARKMFFPLSWFFLLIGLVFIIIIIAMGLFGGGIAALVMFARGQDSTLALFLGIFSSLVALVIGLGVVFGIFAISTYGIAVLFFKKPGAMASFRESIRFLWNHQYAFWLYVVLVVGYFIASIMLMLVVYPFQLIPFMGAVLAIPLQILSSIAQSYLGLVLVAVIFVYYHDSEIRQPEIIERMNNPETSAGDSTDQANTYNIQDPGPDEFLPERDGSPEI